MEKEKRYETHEIEIKKNERTKKQNKIKKR